MEISVTFRVLAHKFYQNHFRNDYYSSFTKNEKIQIKTYITEDVALRKSLVGHISNHSEYKGKVSITDLVVDEKNNKLYLKIDTIFINKINYTSDRIKELKNICKCIHLHIF